MAGLSQGMRFPCNELFILLKTNAPTVQPAITSRESCDGTMPVSIQKSNDIKRITTGLLRSTSASQFSAFLYCLRDDDSQLATSVHVRNASCIDTESAALTAF